MRAAWRDRDGDGRPDVWSTYTYTLAKEGKGEDQHSEVTVDRNHDGTPDYWRLELNHVPVREWGDLNTDGRVDLWTFSVSLAQKSWQVMDKNYDGTPDAWVYYGPTGQGALRPGAVPGMPSPVAVEMDEDFDGRPEKSIGEFPKERPALGGVDPPWPKPSLGE